MNENLYANLKAYADLGRNAFPLHHKQTYGIKLGEITPVKCLHTIPGDYFKVSLADKSLSFPMNTAAFLDARKEFVAYHVPYNHLNSLFNQFQASRPDPKTSSLVNTSGNVEMNISLHQLYFLTYGAFFRYLAEKYLMPIYYNYGDDSDKYSFNVGSTTLSFEVEPIRDSDDPLIFYFDIPSGIYDEFESELGVYGSFGYGLSLPSKDILGRRRAYNWVRKLDLLGYGNLYPIFKKVEAVFELCFSKHSVYGSSTGTGLHGLDPYSQDELNAMDCAFNFGFARIVELCFESCIIEKSNMKINFTGTAYPRYVSLYPILSYNKVFYEFFRNTYYDLDYDVKDFNIDFLYSVNGQSFDISIDAFSPRLLDIEYHQYKKDLLTGSLPSAQFGAVSSLVINSVDLNLTGTASSTVLFNHGNNTPVSAGPAKFLLDGSRSVLVDSSDLHAYHSHPVFVSGSVPAHEGFDVIALKRAEMLQEYRQTLLRNGNRTGDIFKGIYGHRPASEDDNSPRFIDAFGSSIFVDTIVSTADTSTTDSVKGSLGDLGARSVINGSGHFTFKTSDFGCLLFLAYIVPENEYGSLMLDEHLIANDPESHFLPFFQNLGFQPIHNHNVNLYACRNNDAVRGYAPSYSKFKQELSVVHGNFVSLSKDLLFKSYIIGNQGGNGAVSALLQDAGIEDDYVGSFNHWVALNNAIQQSNNATLAQYYVSPNMWDNVFVQKAGDDFESDHFVCRCFLGIESVRVLSKLGLPNF